MENLLFGKRYSLVSLLIAFILAGILVFQFQENQIAKLKANQQALAFERAFAQTQAIIDQVQWNSNTAQLANAFASIGYKVKVQAVPQAQETKNGK